MANYDYYRDYTGDLLDYNQLFLKHLYDLSNNNNTNEFLLACETFINDSSYTGYFNDFGGRPASSFFRAVNYEYCVCPTEWVRVHRQHDEKACNCFHGKRFVLYRIAEKFSNNIEKERVQDFICHLGPINVQYKRWQNIEETQQ